ncbi:hypothetical protein [Kitasatospora sp. McL0602]|uniref:hypothetical protein n=1 Tax=Kitasatospora sp. McL0602 TaxID=3439530 RepID=UPI003F89965F
MSDTPTPAEAIPGGVVHPETPPAPDPVAEAETPEGDPRDAELAYLRADLETMEGRHHEAATEADELRWKAVDDANAAASEMVIAGYSDLPAFAVEAARTAARYLGSGEELRALCENLAEACTPRPVLGKGGLTPDAPPRPDAATIAARAMRGAW